VKEKKKVPELIAYAGPIETTDAYATALKVKLLPQTSKAMVHIKELDVNDVDWKILGSIDDDIYFEEMAEAEVTQDDSDVHEVTKAWIYLDIQVKSAVSNNSGEIAIAVSGA
jgi:hypothetical protein